MYIPYDLLKEWSYRILLSLSTSLVLPASDTELLPVLARRLLSCEGCIRSLTLTGGSVCLGEETPRVSAISLSWISRDTPTRGQDSVKKMQYEYSIILLWPWDGTHRGSGREGGQGTAGEGQWRGRWERQASTDNSWRDIHKTEGDGETSLRTYAPNPVKGFESS